MKQRECKIVFEPSGRSVYVLPDSLILEAAAQAGFIVQTPCGGAGVCGKCRVKVVSGPCAATETCRKLMGEGAVEEGYRLACKATVGGDLVVEVPEASLFGAQQQILVTGAPGAVEVHPSVRRAFVNLGLPAEKDSRSDVERLTEALGPFDISIRALRQLPGALRAAGFRGAAILTDGALIDFQPGDVASRCCGVAMDIGTTTLVGALVDLQTGADLGVEARINPQTSYGDDVISRIRKCREDREGLPRLQEVVVEAVNGIIGELARKANISRSLIYEVVFAGNTAMQEILCGIDPSALGELPFSPVFNDALQLDARDLRLTIHPDGKVYVFPQIGGFVGGDTVAGIAVSRLDRDRAPVLFVDIGTNGEIVLSHHGRLIATSVAAGPAFEGARISCGMRAAGGAIEKVLLDGDVRINVIGNTRPAGLCGSGLIDAAAELLRVGIVDFTGRIQAPDETPAGLSAGLRERLVNQDGHWNFILAQGDETASGEPLILTQKDIRELQLATAAIRAGIRILLGLEGLDVGDLHGVLLAGGFGNFIRRNHARRIGLLPPIPGHRIRFIGNASLFGAKRALLSVDEKNYASRLAKTTRHVDLSLSPDFQMEFSSAMLFPEEDPGLECDAEGSQDHGRQTG